LASSASSPDPDAAGAEAEWAATEEIELAMTTYFGSGQRNLSP
jgi:hypothetical protein